MPTPIIETGKKDVDGVKEDFDIKSIEIESASRAVIETLSQTRAARINRLLNWIISSYGRDEDRNGHEGDKLNFTIKQKIDWLKKPTNSLIMEGDLSAGFNYLRENYISNSTHKKLLEELSKFIKNKTEEKENTQTISYKK